MNERSYPLTHPQKRIWYTERIHPGTALHNIVGSVRVRGPLDYRLLASAIRERRSRHDALRLSVQEADGIPVQSVSGLPPDDGEFRDFSGSENPEAEFASWVARVASEPFDLENGPLCAFPMYRIGDRDGGFLVKFHHLVSDGWSSSLFISLVRRSYERLLRGEPDEEPASPSYLDYIGREAEYVRSGRFRKNGEFWRRKFSGWPAEPPPEPSPRTEGRRRTFALDAERSAAVKAFASEAGGSLTGFFIFLYLLYAYKSEGRSETVVGTPVFNRSGPKDKATVGMFTSTMPFRFALDASASSRETLARVNRELAECYHHQKYPYDLLVQDLGLKRRGLDRLFDVSVNTYNTKVETEWAGSPAEVLEHYGGCQLHSLQLVVKDWSETGELTVEIDYKTAEYDEERIERLYARLVGLIDAALAEPEQPVARLSLLTAEERASLAAFNDTRADYPRDRTVVRLIEEQAERTPERTAVTDGPLRLTYRELTDRAARLAARIGSRGGGRGSTVGLLTRHSPETVVAILAVLKAGAAYVPIDPAYPAERIGYMLEDAGCRLLLANVPLPEGTGFAGPVLDLGDPHLYAKAAERVRLPDEGAGPDDLAYVIYTSGSTGLPKGAMIEHRGLVNYVWWARRMYAKDEDEVFPLYSSLAFDLTVTSVFTPLVMGGSVAVYRDDEEEYVLYRIMREKKATVVKLTPAHLSLLKDYDHRGSAVKRFIVGGEDLRTDLAKRIHESFGGRIEIYNEYGPTETVVGCMIHRYDPERDVRASVPIGAPADNVGIHLLDADGNPVPEGVLGELYITGDGVARGYRNRPELTAERFLPCPFLPGERMYRTGDLARRLASGALEYAGRADRQVKIRGHRIEPGEIERALSGHPSVREAVVVDRETPDGSKILCAYAVRDSKAAEGDKELLDYLAERLPSYMVPACVLELDAIPLNANGKVDRAKLPEPPDRSARRAGEAFGDEAAADSRDNWGGAAAREISALLEVASGVLQEEAISPADRFHELGGDSIKAIQLSSRLRSRGYAIRVADVLAYPKFADMAARMERLGGFVPGGEDDRCEGEAGLTPIVDWFATRPFADRHHYNQSVLLRLHKPLAAEELTKIVRGLVAHHDSLRLSFDPETGGRLVYNAEPEVEDAESFDLSGLDGEEQQLRMSELGARLKASFRPGRDALLKARLFDLGRNGRRLLLTAHHLAVDAVSWSILLEDFARLWRNLSRPEPLPLPPKTASYKRWAEHLRSRAEDAGRELDYWREAVGDGGAAEPAGGDGIAPPATESLSAELTERLLRKAPAAYGTDVEELLVAALAAAAQDSLGAAGSLAIELEGHGREPSDPSADVSRTVGWFTCLYPVRLPLPARAAEEPWPARVRAVKQTLRAVPSGGLGFGLLTRLVRALDDPGEGRRLRFNYVGELDSALGAGELFSLAEEPSGPDSGAGNPPTAPLDVVAMVARGRLRLTVAADGRTHGAEAAAALARSFAARLTELLRQADSVRGSALAPSDFPTIALSQEALDSLYS